MLGSLRYILFPVLNLTGSVLMSFAGLMLIPLAIAHFTNDGANVAFATGVAATFCVGLLLFVSLLKKIPKGRNHLVVY